MPRIDPPARHAGTDVESSRPDGRLLLELGGLATLAFLVRLLPVLAHGGLTGIADYDDGVYMGSALALVRGHVVYRDFFMLHPPGIVYVLSPFAALSLVTTDATAFAAARLGFMVLGALNTFLVGLVALRAGRIAALAAAALYAAWIVPAFVEQSTWLIAPQTTLLLLALLTLTPSSIGPRPGSITWRRAAVAGALIGLCGTIQIWGAAIAAAAGGWLLLRVLRQPGGWLRPIAAYCAAGVGAVALAFLPFLAAAGDQMLRLIIVDQLGRPHGAGHVLARLRALEGMPDGVIRRLHVEALPVLLMVIVALAIAWVAWRRPGIRLWAALFATQAALLLASPSFFFHYAAWLAPAVVLCIGAIVAELVTILGRVRRGPTAVASVYVVGVLALLVVSAMPVRFGMKNPSRPFDAQAVAAAIADARCPTGDYPSVLIGSGALRRMIDNGCPVLISPTSISYDADRELGSTRNRFNQPEYQAAMAAYYGDSDAAMFTHPKVDRLTDATWAAIRRQLPIELEVHGVLILLRAAP